MNTPFNPADAAIDEAHIFFEPETAGEVASPANAEIFAAPPSEEPPRSAADESAPATFEQPETDEAAAAHGARRQAFRQRLAERIRQSRRLPRGLRERLSQIVETVQLSDDAPEPALPLADAVTLLEESLPEAITAEREHVEVAEHPRGDGYFNSGELSDRDAQRIAAEQLRTYGFLPADA